MTRALTAVAGVMMGLAFAATSSSQGPSAPVVPDYVHPPVVKLAARTIRTYPAPEADQGVAVDARFFYPVDNSVVGKYDLATGSLVGRWIGARNGLIRHLNSCLAENARLWCANSNYPEVPMGSSVEVFDSTSMTHVATHSLGMRDEGSLTWLDRMGSGWMAGFAHYDESGSLGFKDHRFSSVVTFDAGWQRTGGWLFPGSVLALMAPHAASGGAIGPDGWLYLLGHDKPELYVVARPAMGPTMIHVATIQVEAEGQAFSWARDGSRTIFAIDRRKLLVRQIVVPELPPSLQSPDARPFR